MVVPCGCEVANAYAPTSSSRLEALGWPTSAADTLTVIVHGCEDDGWAGQDTVPFSVLPPDPASG